MRKKNYDFKAIHFLLIAVIIIVYAYLARLLFADDLEMPIVTAQIENQAVIPVNSGVLAQHKRDPFRSKRLIKAKKKKVKIVAKPVVKKEPVLPVFKIQGKSINSGKIQLAISFRNQFYLINQGDQIAEMHFDLIDDEQIKITYKNKLFTKSIPDL